MSTPGSDPSAVIPPDPVITPEEAAAQEAAAADAAARAALNNQIRDLATEIAKQTLTSFDPATIRKGLVVSIQGTVSPPTLTVTISGDTLEIPGVRYYEHYIPQPGDVVHLLKQGTDLTAIGKVAEQQSETDFTTVALATGFTHNGNDNGTLQVRRIWSHGRWKVEWIGGVARSSGDTVITALDAKYRPTSRRSMGNARTSSGAIYVRIDFETSGAVNLIGMESMPVISATTPSGHTHSGPSHTHGGGSHDHTVATTNFQNIGSTSGTSNSHTHSITGGTSGGQNVTHTHDLDHTHQISGGTGSSGITTGAAGTGQTGNDTDSAHNHTLTVNEPTWISFNGLGYFI